MKTTLIIIGIVILVVVGGSMFLYTMTKKIMNKVDEDNDNER